jgi:hypothetical protein
MSTPLANITHTVAARIIEALGIFVPQGEALRIIGTSLNFPPTILRFYFHQQFYLFF